MSSMDCEIDLKLDMAINPTNKKDCLVMMSALRLLSVHTGQAFKKYFPRDKGKQALGDLIICVAKAYKIMTSRCMLNEKDNWKSALRMHYNKQFGILNQLHTLMRKIKFSTPQIYFQAGIIRTIQSIWHFMITWSGSWIFHTSWPVTVIKITQKLLTVKSG